MGIDIWEVIAAASTKPFGFHPFYPRPSLRGHCIISPASSMNRVRKSHSFAFQERCLITFSRR